jgi:molybdopterin/thiamine biosynthesis adenylyltransferase
LTSPLADAGDRHARTRLWLGDEGLAAVCETPVCIVGAGGTGSLCLTFAAYLGFRDFLLVDDDRLDASNLNRFVNATPADIGRHKIDVLAADLALKVPQCRVERLPHQFPSIDVIDRLADERFLVIGCVDSVKPRIELDILCRRLGLTYVDVGTGFGRDAAQTITDSGGQVLVSRAGGACLMCLGFTHLLDTRDYLVPGGTEAEPSVLTLNAVMAAVAVDLAVAIAAGHPREHNKVMYSRDRFTAASMLIPPSPDCAICGTGAAARVAGVLGQVPDAERR